MRKLVSGGFALLLATGMLFGFAPQAAADHTPEECPEGQSCEFPTPQDCADGEHNGQWDGGSEGRGSVCVGGGGQVGFYAGGNAATPCGVVIVANQNVVNLVMGGDASDWGDDPNNCE